MYKYIVCFLLFTAFIGTCADLTLNDGTVLLNAEIKSCAAGFVGILHEKGEAEIALENLPENFIAALSSRQRNALRNGSDIKLPDGTIYKNCIVKKYGKNLLTIKHSQGTCDIAFKNLPKYYRTTFSAKMLARISGSTASRGNNADVVGKTANGQLVYIGPRGGRYYLSDNGRKVYLRKDVEVKPVEGVKTNALQP